MADLIIPAALKIWLIFLLVFIFFQYPVPFSIIFGAIGGIAGGIVSAWWQMKGGSPSDGPKGKPPADKLKRPDPDGSNVNPRWDVTFLKSNAAQRRYIERRKKARMRRLNK
mgnify:FL=1